MENNNKPLISIIIPVYKVEQYLRKCVDSVLNQTYHNLEILLVDDGSPDNSGWICDDYANKDPRIKAIHINNGGLSHARNIAIEVASGDCITFIDSDDYVTKDYVGSLYELIKKYDAQIAITSPNTFYDGTAPALVSKENLCEKIMESNEAMINLFYQNDFDTSAWAKLYKRELFAGDIRYPNGWLYEDVPTTYRLFQRCKKIAFKNYKNYNYRLRTNSIEGGPFKQQKYESCISIINQLENDMPTMNITVQKALKCRIASLAFHILLETPISAKNYRKDLLDKIKKYRKIILFDKHARKKTRIACMLSYGGMILINTFSKYGKSRN